MFRVATVLPKKMTELNDAVSEEDKTVAITKIVLQLMNKNGHQNPQAHQSRCI
jgi:hypothetical protein